MELPISIVAWLTVVVVQAVIHFIVFGARRERIQQEEEALFETLSLTTSESFTTAATMDADAVSSQQRVEQYFRETTMVSSSSLLDDSVDDEDDILVLERTAADAPDAWESSWRLEDDDDLIVEPSPYFLMQTGKDILRVSTCSIAECIPIAIFHKASSHEILNLSLAYRQPFVYYACCIVQHASLENVVEEQIRALPQ